MRGYLALIVTFGFVAVVLGLGLGVLTVVDSPAILILFGALATNWGSIIGWYFGSADTATRAPTRKTDEVTLPKEVKA